MVDLAGRQLANPLRDTAILLLLFDTGIPVVRCVVSVWQM
jgi:hypothetical protein